MRFLLLLTAILSCATVAFPGAAPQDPAEFFEKSVRPILADRCIACHNPALLEAGLDLTSASGFENGATTGPIVDRHNPEASRLVVAVSYEDRVKMPPDGRLSPDELGVLQTWVQSGAVWPGATKADASMSREPRVSDADIAPRGFDEADTHWWAFQPLGDPSVPEVESDWPRNDIDRFILAKLNEKKLKPVPPADKWTLLRRTSFNLTGLPPGRDEVERYINDRSEDAFQKLVDRLLASPRYGERFGRHWLDVARYADSTGNDEDHRYPHAWRYRDYVIDAFNRDEPYDAFVKNQVAGDLLPSSDSSSVNARGIVATGLLALGPKALAQQDKMKMLYDVYDEQLDVVSKAFMGLTVTCARCHDHKFDPIPTRDYYSLVSIFANTQSFQDSTTHVAKLLERPLVPPQEYERYRHAENRRLYKQADIAHVIDRATSERNRVETARMAEMMLTAREVYEDGIALERAAENAGIDVAMLGKWVRYLSPREIVRPHMLAWHEASQQSRRSVALDYQARFRQALEEWDAKIETRWQEILELSKSMEDPPPRRPEILEGKDRFFYDVHFHRDGPLRVHEADWPAVFSVSVVERIDALQHEHGLIRRQVPPRPPMATTVAEGEPVLQTVFLRGDYRNPGEQVPFGFLSVLEREATERRRAGSGRLQLANWLASPDHPLTARVMVNRVWQWHFGEALVRTPNNFGRMGERPSHPELLDYLALRFIESGWSVKALNRMILSSNTYRMASAASAEAAERDPGNLWLSHYNRRRLDVEEIRDGLLAIDGSLDLRMGGTLDPGTGTDLENSNARLSIDPTTVHRRTVYLPLRRANLPTILGLFDFGDAVNSVGQRARTNVAPQALFMMNSEFVNERAKTLTEKFAFSRQAEEETALRSLYLSILNRPASDEEIEQGARYRKRYEASFLRPGIEREAWQSLCRILIASNEFIYLD